MDGGGFLARDQAETRLRRQKRYPVSGVAPEDFLRPLAIAAVVACSIILLAWATPAKGEPNYPRWTDQVNHACFEIAAFVEAAEETADPIKRSRQWQAWLYLAQSPYQESIVIRARNAYKARISSDDLYRQCYNLS